MILKSNNESETKEIGRKLGKKLKPGDVVCLIGELGTGKTTMVKGIASVFGIEEREIASASFIIIAEYNKNIPFYHIDLYRLENEEIPEIGLYEYLFEAAPSFSSPGGAILTIGDHLRYNETTCNAEINFMHMIFYMMFKEII